MPNKRRRPRQGYGHDGVLPPAVVNGICSRDWSPAFPAFPFSRCRASHVTLLEVEGQENVGLVDA